MSATAEHFTAWVTTDTTVLPGENIDVSVLEDELTGYKGDDEEFPMYESVGEPVFYFETDVNARAGQPDDMLRQIANTLRESGWTVVSRWDGVATGYIATVERA